MSGSSSSSSLEAKIVVLGSQGVGKTSLVHRYVKNAFAPSIHSTIGASFLTKRVVDIDSSSVVRLQIWDTAGQERFRSISKLYYRGANAALLCYDITSAASFTEMGHWLVELRSNLPEDTILHVVGTKADVVAEDPSKRQVPFERVIAYVAENLYPGSAQQNQQATNSGQAPPVNTPALERTVSSILGVGGGANKSKQELRPDPPLASPNSNRSSINFWGQDLGWDCCHEISASTGEGVEEVFRVITRRLVEQRNNRAALELRLMQELGGITPGLDDRNGFFNDYATEGSYPHMNGNGSFRVGIGDKRRSWLGLTQFPGYNGDGDTQIDSANITPQRKGCC
ncbi:uncharacterized protein PV09_00943 [Verruconis gallopava]|uniref:GTP-binding protein ypt3 n=1 Tax=Verruconis gallopava TaxID=253628 RepID=A0A0D1Z4X6_9PEZI|nr:uncharacterized protein PV09_00943 [Verruconis gallopava]KIW07997.1 hypothetical protein PV09_00943 [Verruconis gallopava]